ncbi:hypothetical protein QJS10_CPA01g01849 [Acorus calamus]|uniref:Uncharacterized protein n=1 Tax=Acorus calamus TaxID=4465 RepID=A0AAV9FHS5_ACOCL|nr:hypothetical protein QJS10_CPA01g01849 [Acorus calamus]
MQLGNPHFSPKAAKAKEVAQTAPGAQNTEEYHDIMEGKVIPGIELRSAASSRCNSTTSLSEGWCNNLCAHRRFLSAYAGKTRI